MKTQGPAKPAHLDNITAKRKPDDDPNIEEAKKKKTK